MKAWLSSLCALFAFLSPAFAQVGKKYDKLLHYEDVVIRAVDPDGIRIMHKGGVGKIRMESLPPEIVAELGLNKGDAELHRKNEALAENEAAKKDKAAAFLKGRVTKLTGAVLQVKPDGVLIANASFTTGKTKQVKVPYTVTEGGPTTLQPNRKPRVFKQFKTETVPEVVEVDVAWVSCDSKPFIDGMVYEKNVYLLGKYTYMGTDGAEHTVPSFTTDGSRLLTAAGFSEGGENPAKPPTGTSTGTGFFISANGLLLTNYHVVDGRTKLEVQVNGSFVPAKLIKFDKGNDVALLRIEKDSPNYLSLGEDSDVGLAKPVFTVGFPQVDVQGSSAKFTEGSVSALSGAGDDRRYFQISVPIQPGNSGSPLVDSTGTVIGIVTATLRSGISERGLEIAQNVNYALKVSHAKGMLGSAFTPPAAKETPKTREAMVKSVADAVALIKAQ